MTQAFRQCTALESVNIPPSMSTVASALFYQCSGLKKVVLPSTISSIQAAAFQHCTSLEEFHANNPVPVDLSAINNVFSGVPVSTCILYVPVGSKALYEEAPKWQDFAMIVEDAYAGVAEGAASIFKTSIIDGRLCISGLNKGAEVSLFRMDGTRLFYGKVFGDPVSIALPCRGIYLLRYKKTGLKIIY